MPQPEERRHSRGHVILVVASLRGKSELHRVGRWVTPSQGDLEESATERKRPRTAVLFASKQTLGHGFDEVKGKILLGQAERVR